MLWIPNAAHAQSGNVQVDLGVLDKMEAKQRSAPTFQEFMNTPYVPKNKITLTPPKIKLRPVITQPTLRIAPRVIVQETITYPPLPRHKPSIAAPSKKSVQVIKIKAPVPQKRPNTLQPSENYVAAKDIKQTNITMQRAIPVAKVERVQTYTPPVKTQTHAQEKQDFVNIAATPLENRLVTPDATAVLKSIETPNAPFKDTDIVLESKRPFEITTPLEQYIRLEFIGGSVDLLPRHEFILEQDIISTLNTKPDLRIEIQSFATSADNGQSSARRISLARAVSIRSFLIEQNIAPNRIDIRALGEETTLEPIDRSDLFFMKDGERL